jgi:endonuclease I
VFEPRDGQKGDAARAVFYFSIRYGDGCQVKPLAVFDPAHPAASEAVLEEWNLHDPPSDHERQRNDVIEVEQGVRNPFIDHPELVDRVSFQ